MKTKILIFLLCLASLNVMGQGTITRQSTRKTEPQKQKTEQPAKPNSSKKQPGSNQRQNSKPTTGTLNGHEWVDLGLSVKWATCNVGASSPSDYGGYYAWGETSTKSRYNWDNCFDCLDPNNPQKNTSWGTYKLGGKTRITPKSGHDTARENWGGSWRMPTWIEIKELRNKCKWIWTTQGGHNGCKVIGPNGNSIFLPAAGSCREGTIGSGGGHGYYSSSTLSSSYSCEDYGVGFHMYDTGFHIDMGWGNRSDGKSVRPVTE